MSAFHPVLPSDFDPKETWALAGNCGAPTVRYYLLRGSSFRSTYVI